MKKAVLLLFLMVLGVFSLAGYDGFIDIVNETGLGVFYVYVSHVDNESWGDDLLGDKELPDGETFRVHLYGQPSPIFDIQVTDELDGTYTFTYLDVEEGALVVTPDDLDPPDTIFPGEVTVNGPGGDFSGYVDIVNTTRYSVYYLQVRSAGNAWGEDLLGDDVLDDGETFRVNLINFPSPIFDIRVEDDEEDVYTLFNVEVDDGAVAVTPEHMN
jgi:hypothetical protein